MLQCAIKNIVLKFDGETLVKCFEVNNTSIFMSICSDCSKIYVIDSCGFEETLYHRSKSFTFDERTNQYVKQKSFSIGISDPKRYKKELNETVKNVIIAEDDQ